MKHPPPTGRYINSVSEKKPPAPPTDEAFIKELANTQAQLDFLREQLTESQRLATIGTIAAVIAHEFNNLLTPIVSYSQYALQSAESAEPDMELIRKALGKAFGSFVASRDRRTFDHLLGIRSSVWQALSPHDQAVVTGQSFFPHLISGPFQTGLHAAFAFAIGACLIAAAASLMRGGRYQHAEEPGRRLEERYAS